MARKALKHSFYKGSERPVPADLYINCGGFATEEVGSCQSGADFSVQALPPRTILLCAEFVVQ